MAKRKKKPSIKSLIKTMDEQFKEKIFTRDIKEFGSKCSLCLADGVRLIWCHLISARKYSVRWAHRNVYAQCNSCNIRHEHYPEYYTAWWVRRHGEEAYQELVRESMVPANYKRKDYEQMIGAIK